MSEPDPRAIPSQPGQFFLSPSHNHKYDYGRRYVEPQPVPKLTPAQSEQKSAELRKQYFASASQRRDDIIKTISNPTQRMIALNNFDKELARVKADGIAKREKELEGLFGGKKRRKTRKTRKSKKARKTRRTH
jgi:hypothetical protein